MYQGNKPSVQYANMYKDAAPFEYAHPGPPKNAKAEKIVPPMRNHMMNKLKPLSPTAYSDIEKKEYPNLLITTGYWDSQVQYWEPAKWIAKLRDYNRSKNHLLLHTNMDTGHGGASGRFNALKEIAMEYAFLIGLEQKLF